MQKVYVGDGMMGWLQPMVCRRRTKVQVRTRRERSRLLEVAESGLPCTLRTNVLVYVNREDGTVSLSSTRLDR